MSLDGIMLASVKSDLTKSLINGRIDKIFQIEENTITLLIRNNNYNYRLLISAEPNYARLHITKESFTNPLKAPDFCMLLRKYLIRGVITNIIQPDFERIINLEISLYNKKYNLFVEIMGKYSNIILVDENGVVLDSIKRITRQISREREIYPGIKYVYPPKQNKVNPLRVTEDLFIEKTTDFSESAYKAIMYNFRGIGPYSAREIVYRAGINPDMTYNLLDKMKKKDLWLEFNKTISIIKNEDFHPTIGLKNHSISYISAFPLNHLEDEIKFFKDTGQLFDFYYQSEIKGKKIHNTKKRLIAVVNNFLNKNLQKQKSFKKELFIGENAGDFKKMGELIISNLYQLKKGIKEASVIDYYDPQQKNITISLDPSLTPSANAQKYFKKYTKAKKSVKYIKTQLGKLKHEEKYLNQVLLNIEQAETKDDLSEIKEELISEAYIKDKSKKKRKKPTKPLEPYKFLSSNNYEILVGRNNKQNDYLTKKIAKSQDIWLHVKELAGSHVIIRKHINAEIPPETLNEAAVLAAYYSRGRMSENIAIDYTEAKNVCKPKKAKPGLVYYNNYQTIYVTPDKNIVEKLRK